MKQKRRTGPLRVTHNNHNVLNHPVWRDQQYDRTRILAVTTYTYNLCPLKKLCFRSCTQYVQLYARRCKAT